MYSYIKENKNGNKTAKGIKKNIINNELKHINYKDTLLKNKQLYHQMKTIRSQNHQLASYELFFFKSHSVAMMTKDISIKTE